VCVSNREVVAIMLCGGDSEDGSGTEVGQGCAAQLIGFGLDPIPALPSKPMRC
jgi:hypothetical protein